MDMQNYMNDNLIIPDRRPTRSDAVKNRERLLQTAQRLFAENGVDAVTMSEIAETAGVGKGTLYRHFANKIEIGQELLDHNQRDLQNRTLARLRERGDPLADLQWFLGEVVAFVLRNREIMFAGIVTGAMLRHPAHRWWWQTIRGLLTRTGTPLNADYAADMLFVMLEPRTILFQIETHGYTPEQIAAHLSAAAEHLAH